jgi:hypothetical protein
MFSFLTELQFTLACSSASLVAGVIFSQKIKDWVSGIPGDVRSALKGVEADTVAKIAAARASVLVQLPAPAPAKAPLPAAVTLTIKPAAAPAEAPAAAPAAAEAPAAAPTPPAA